eukprot:163101-Chlamydomonas_euryale.AAC.6
MEEPSTDKAAMEEPSTDKAAMEEPSTDKAAMEEPSTDKAAMEEPSTDKAAMEEPSTDKAVTERPATSRAVVRGLKSGGCLRQGCLELRKKPLVEGCEGGCRWERVAGGCAPSDGRPSLVGHERPAVEHKDVEKVGKRDGACTWERVEQDEQHCARPRPKRSDPARA